MQENSLFEYAIIRIVPKVEREEFLNVGVILYCRSQKFLAMEYRLDNDRLKAFPALDVAQVHDYLRAYEHICKGDTTAGPIAKIPIEERFRWLTANRSTIVQYSGVHPGLCSDAKEMLMRLFEKMVL